MRTVVLRATVEHLFVCYISWWRAFRPTVCLVCWRSAPWLVTRLRWLTGALQSTSMLTTCPTTSVSVARSCGFAASRGYNIRFAITH